jgi:hypothetical protein
MRRDFLEPVFVEFIPAEIEPGKLYISITYATASHLCACACGERVVTPFSPADWRLTFDGETVSLYPSIGNWAQKCRSHYWIRENQIVWGGALSDSKIAAARTRDRQDTERHFGERVGGHVIAPKPQGGRGGGWLARLLGRL